MQRHGDRKSALLIAALVALMVAAGAIYSGRRAQAGPTASSPDPGALSVVFAAPRGSTSSPLTSDAIVATFDKPRPPCATCPRTRRRVP